MKQHPVPENIMDVEFKLFGSLTAKQFGYIVAGGIGGVIFFYLFRGLQSTFLGWIFASLSVMLGLSLALIRVNEQPFEVWLGNFLTAMFSSQKRVWQKQKKSSHVLLDKPSNVAVAANFSQTVPGQTQTPVPAPVGLSNVQASPPEQKKVEVKEEKAPIPEHPFRDFSTPAPSVTNQDPPPQMQAAIAGEPAKGEMFNVPGSAQGFVRISTNQEPNRPISVQGNMSNSMQNNSSGTAQQGQPLSDNVPNPLQNDGSKSGVGSRSAGSADPSNDQSSATEPDFQVVEPLQKVDKEPETFFLNEQLDQTGQSQSAQNTSNVQATESKPTIQTTQSSPSAVVPVQGVLGQQDLSTQSSQPVEKIENKGQQFSDILPDKREVIDGSLDANSQSPAGNTQLDELGEANQALRQKVVEFSEEKSKLEGELTEVKGKYTMLENQNKQMLADLELIKKQLEAKTLPDLKPSIQMVPGGAAAQTVSSLQAVQQDGDSGALSPLTYNGPSLSRKPNVISGIVKSKSGKLLPGVVVIVKNEKGRPVRAMKTNSLGQFVTTTALDSGNYVIELSKNDLSFGRYEVILEGNVMPTYEFLSY
ncbi:MAG: PrgI family protein [Patescibacteria group bacterium]|nr:PrgI family protein [Patescibacteria group bacterium]